MEKIERSLAPDNERGIFTEGINYFETGPSSIWGLGDPDMLKTLADEEFSGRWLNLAAGDGRYNSILLEKGAQIVACDIDPGALSKLWHMTPEDLRARLETVTLDLQRPLPFTSARFDGVFSTGTLHLFPKSTLTMVFSEIKRVLRNGGKMLIDFATDIERVAPAGRRITFGSEPLYATQEAKEFLSSMLKEYDTEMRVSSVEEEFQGANPPYVLRCKFLIVLARKP